MPTWSAGYDLSLAANKLEAAKNLSSDGKVSFEAFSHAEHVALVNSMVTLNPEIPDLEKQGIVRQAVSQAGAGAKISAKALQREVARAEKTWLRRPSLNYRLVTSITVSPFFRVRRATIHGSSVVLSPKLSRRHWKERDSVIERSRDSVVGKLPTRYASVSVSVSGRSPIQAGERALDRLDILRGIWNLWINRRTSFRISLGGRRDPVNRILLGPFHTLHERNGAATSSWWYEPDYRGPAQLFDPRADSGKMLRFTEDVRRQLRRIQYSGAIERAIIRYVRALDTPSWDECFLKLWSILEFLTDTGRDSYKTTIRRTSFLFVERSYVRQVLTHLRDYRNRAAHTGSATGDVEAVLWQLKSYVEQLLRFHFGTRLRFDSLADACEFMDLSADRSEIRRDIGRLQNALRFRTP